MYIHPKSFLSRLLEAVWTIVLIVLLLWLAAQLLADVWGWLVIIVAVVVLVRLGMWVRRLHRDEW